MLADLSSAEITEWAAYEQITGPLGPRRMDILVAQLCAVVANANRGKGGKKAQAKDFLPEWNRGLSKEQGWQEMKAAAQSINAAFGGTVNGRGQKKPRPKRKPKPTPVDRHTAGGRYRVGERGGLATVIDTRTDHTEWTGLDEAQAAAIAQGLNSTTS